VPRTPDVGAAEPQQPTARGGAPAWTRAGAATPPPAASMLGTPRVGGTPQSLTPQSPRSSAADGAIHPAILRSRVSLAAPRTPTSRSSGGEPVVTPPGRESESERSAGTPLPAAQLEIEMRQLREQMLAMQARLDLASAANGFASAEDEQELGV